MYFLDTKKSYLQGFLKHKQHVCDTCRHFWKISEQKIGTCPKRVGEDGGKRIVEVERTR